MKFQNIILCAILFLFLSAGHALGCGGGPPVLPRGGGANGPPPCEDPPSCPEPGAPAWSVNMVNMNLFVSDVPLWYTPPIGPSIQAKLSYNSLVAVTGHELFGNKWIFGYNSFLETDTDGKVTVTLGTGRKVVYPVNEGGYDHPYKNATTLVKISDNHFELRYSWGKVYVYSHHAAGLQKIFLTEIRDARGQQLTLAYDSQDRLSTITDAQSRITALLYNAENLVESIEDPFNRSASFEYDANRNLVLP